MKKLDNVIKRLKIIFKNRKSKKPKEKIRTKVRSSIDSFPKGSFLNKHNQEILNRYKKPVVRDLGERKRVFNEVKESLIDLQSKNLKNGGVND